MVGYNPNQETEDMEVHHHSHSQGKKNWKSYIWEFVMLFLAVFCGFLAEYQLEHILEHRREKQYIETMIQDIKEDTAKLKASLTDNIQKSSALDSFLNTIYTVPYNDSSLRSMYYFYRKYLSTRFGILFTKRTITQLKYSGGLRLIRNRNASDSIVVYDEYCTIVERQLDGFADNYQLKAREFSSKIFDSKYLLNYDRNNIDALLKTNTKVTLLSNDQNLIKEYANWIYSAKAVLDNYIFLLKTHLQRAKRIIQFLKKEYDLD